MSNHDEVIARRKAVWARYYAGLSELAAGGALTLPRAEYADRVANAHIFYVLPESLTTRMALAAHLKARDMLSVSHYVPLHSSPGGMRWGRAAIAPIEKHMADAPQQTRQETEVLHPEEI